MMLMILQQFVVVLRGCASTHFFVPFLHRLSALSILSTPRHSKASEGRGEGIRKELVSLHHGGQGFRHTNQRSSLAGLRYSRAQGLAELYCRGIRLPKQPGPRTMQNPPKPIWAFWRHSCFLAVWQSKKLVLLLSSLKLLLAMFELIPIRF